MSDKPPKKPAWYKNTYFWIAFFLLGAGIAGLPFIGGDALIRDPGQKRENFPLFVIYLGAAVLMVVNGILSHRQTVLAYNELSEKKPK